MDLVDVLLEVLPGRGAVHDLHRDRGLEAQLAEALDGRAHLPDDGLGLGGGEADASSLGGLLASRPGREEEGCRAGEAGQRSHGEADSSRPGPRPS